MRGSRVAVERNELSVCDDLITLWRCDRERHGCFCGRMIEGWNPVMNSIGPIVSGRGCVAVTVVCENQSVFGMAMISDRNRQLLATRCRVSQRDIQRFRRAIKLCGCPVNEN